MIQSSFGSTWLSSLFLTKSFLFKDIEIFAISFRKSNKGLFISNQVNVWFPSWKRFPICVLKMNNTYASNVSFEIEDLSDSTNVVTSSNIGEMSRFILNPLDDLSLFEIILDSVSLVNFRVRESNSSSITSDNVWDFVGSNCFLAHFQQF